MEASKSGRRSRPKNAFKGSVLIGTLTDYDQQRFTSRVAAVQFAQRLLDVGQIESLSGSRVFEDSVTQLYRWSDESVVREARRMVATTSGTIPKKKVIEVVDLHKAGGEQGFNMEETKEKLLARKPPQINVGNTSAKEKIQLGLFSRVNKSERRSDVTASPSGKRTTSERSVSVDKLAPASQQTNERLSERHASAAGTSNNDDESFATSLERSEQERRPQQARSVSRDGVCLLGNRVPQATECVTPTTPPRVDALDPPVSTYPPSRVVSNEYPTQRESDLLVDPFGRYQSIESLPSRRLQQHTGVLSSKCTTMGNPDLNSSVHSRGKAEPLTDIEVCRYDGIEMPALDLDNVSFENQRAPTSGAEELSTRNQSYSDNEKQLLESIKRMTAEHQRVVHGYESKINELTQNVNDLKKMTEIMQANEEKKRGAGHVNSGQSTGQRGQHVSESANDYCQSATSTCPGAAAVASCPPLSPPPAPPPPPPPPLAPAPMTVVRPSKPALKPRVKMRPLFWNRIILDREQGEGHFGDGA